MSNRSPHLYTLAQIRGKQRNHFRLSGGLLDARHFQVSRVANTLEPAAENNFDLSKNYFEMLFDFRH